MLSANIPLTFIAEIAFSKLQRSTFQNVAATAFLSKKIEIQFLRLVPNKLARSTFFNYRAEQGSEPCSGTSVVFKRRARAARLSLKRR